MDRADRGRDPPPPRRGHLHRRRNPCHSPGGPAMTPPRTAAPATASRTAAPASAPPVQGASVLPGTPFPLGATPGRPGGQVSEFKTMMDTLHQAGLEVILDVVFNYTGSWRCGGVERQIPGHHAGLLAQPPSRDRRVRQPLQRLFRPVRHGRPPAHHRPPTRSPADSVRRSAGGKYAGRVRNDRRRRRPG